MLLIDEDDALKFVLRKSAKSLSNPKPLKRANQEAINLGIYSLSLP